MSRHLCGWHCPTLREGGRAIFVTGSARFYGLGSGGSAGGDDFGGSLSPSFNTLTGFLQCKHPLSILCSLTASRASPQRGFMRGHLLAEIWGAMRFLGYSPTRPPKKKLCPSKKGVH